VRELGARRDREEPAYAGRCEERHGHALRLGERSAEPIGATPDDRHEQADQRHVRVAIGERLIADLDDADHRHQRAEEEQPADQRSGMSAPAGRDRERARRRECEEREGYMRRSEAPLCGSGCG
jgi:hypothetical protein